MNHCCKFSLLSEIPNIWRFVFYLLLIFCRSVFPKKDGGFSELSSSQQPLSEVNGRAQSANHVVIVDYETLSTDIADQDDRTMACITEEWKQLVVSEEPKLHSPSCMPKAKLDQSSIAPRNGNRQLDKETSRILERLEVPRPLKGKKASPVSNESCVKNKTVPTKKPLIPFQPTQNTEQVIVGSQLLKPNFQRQKRKQRWKERNSAFHENNCSKVYKVRTFLFPFLSSHELFCC